MNSADYGDDRMGLQEAQQALYKKHGISMGAGCLFSILPMLLIWPVYRIISAPLRYTMVYRLKICMLSPTC